MASDRRWALDLADAWDREAVSLARQADARDMTDIERRLLRMHARVRTGCATELRAAAQKMAAR